MTWVHTFTGQRFDLFDPTPESVRIADIAHALSQICRYTGHAKRFLSVAEHCVLVADELYVETGIPELAWSGLLHDAHEAYTGDVATPIKRVLGDSWRDFERHIERIVRRRFGVLHSVREADLRALVTERREVLPHPELFADWDLPDAEPYPVLLHHWAPLTAERHWLEAAARYAPSEHVHEVYDALRDCEGRGILR